jgi:tetratricopeptide (TPR) repeat protein
LAASDNEDLDALLINLTNEPRPMTDGETETLVGLLMAYIEAYIESNQSDRLDTLISHCERGFARIPIHHPLRATCLQMLATCLKMRFVLQGNRADMEESISLLEEAMGALADDDESKPNCLAELSAWRSTRLAQTDDPADLAAAIRHMQQAANLSCEPTSKAEYLVTLSDLHMVQYARDKQVAGVVPSHISDAIQRLRDAIPLVQPPRSDVFWRLSQCYRERSETLRNMGDVDACIAALQQAITFAAGNTSEQATYFYALSQGYDSRFRQYSGSASDDTATIQNLQQAVSASRSDPNQVGLIFYLNNLGIRLCSRFLWSGHMSDIEASIERHTEAAQLSDAGGLRNDVRGGLAIAYMARFKQLGLSHDLDSAIANMEYVLLLVDDNSVIAEYESRLGDCYSSRFVAQQDGGDLNATISNLQSSIARREQYHPTMAEELYILGRALHARFQRQKEDIDVDVAISILQVALGVANCGDQSKGKILLRLGSLQTLRFSICPADGADIRASIMNLQQAIKYTADDDPSKAVGYNCLADSLFVKFLMEGTITDDTVAIPITVDVVSAPLWVDTAAVNELIICMCSAIKLPCKTWREKVAILTVLGVLHRSRFHKAGNWEDLESAVKNLQSAIHDIPDDEPPLQKVLVYEQLVAVIIERFPHFGSSDPNVLQRSHIVDFEYLVNLVPHDHGRKPGLLITLGLAQRFYFVLHHYAVDVDASIRNLNEALTLVSQLPEGDWRTYGISQIHLSLARASRLRFEHYRDPPDIESAVSGLRTALSLTPDGGLAKAECLFQLGISLSYVFELKYQLDDLESGISSLLQAVKLMPDECSDLPRCRALAGMAFFCRYGLFSDIMDLDLAASYLHWATNQIADNDKSKPEYLASLARAQLTRYERMQDLSELDSSIRNLERAIEIMADDRVGHMYFAALSRSLAYRFLSNPQKNSVDLDASVSNAQRAVERVPENSPDMMYCLGCLGTSQSTRYFHQRSPVDLNKAISSLREAIELSIGSGAKSERLKNDYTAAQAQLRLHLGTLLVEGSLKGDCKSLSDGVEILKSLASEENYSVGTNIKLMAARAWAIALHQAGDLQSALDGYILGLSILPLMFAFHPKSSTQLDILTMANPEDLATMSAACAIELGQFERAVELLDAGRATYWRESAYFRQDLTDLKARHPRLAKQFEMLSEKLSNESFSESLDTFPGMDGSFISGNSSAIRKLSLELEEQSLSKIIDSKVLDSTDNLNGFNSKSQEASSMALRGRLARLWRNTLGQIRQLPEYKNFLKWPRYVHLRRIANGGSVVIINACRHRVDALIIDSFNPICHIPLQSVDYKTIELMSTSIQKRPPVYAMENEKMFYERRHLRPALRWAWTEIVEPIFQKLPQQPHGNSLPRIWWYLTGPLTFIPIHAAGPFNSPKDIDVSQLVISSYITSLGSLLKAKMRVIKEVERGRLLIVNQTDTRGYDRLPASREEAERVIQVAQSSGWAKDAVLHLQDDKATVESVLRGFDGCSWIHMACHGVQHPSSAMESAFILHDGSLKLGQIASKRLTMNVRFAFLSMCQSATGLQKLPGEAMHLAAAVQFSGVPSIIATMWAVRDDDGPDIAEETYRYLLGDGSRGLDPTKAAAALHHAVNSVRKKKGMSLERWAVFIHMGI